MLLEESAYAPFQRYGRNPGRQQKGQCIDLAGVEQGLEAPQCRLRFDLPAPGAMAILTLGRLDLSWVTLMVQSERDLPLATPTDRGEQRLNAVLVAAMERENISMARNDTVISQPRALSA